MKWQKLKILFFGAIVLVPFPFKTLTNGLEVLMHTLLNHLQHHLSYLLLIDRQLCAQDTTLEFQEKRWLI